MDTPTLEQIIEKLSSLTVVEACKLALDLEDAWGVMGAGREDRSQWSGMMYGGPRMRSAPAYGAPMPRDADIDFVLRLESVGDRAVHVMQALRELFKFSLQELKEKLSKTPMVMKDDLTREAALDAQKRLELLGAKVVISTVEDFTRGRA